MKRRRSSTEFYSCDSDSDHVNNDDVKTGNPMTRTRKRGMSRRWRGSAAPKINLEEAEHEKVTQMESLGNW